MHEYFITAGILAILVGIGLLILGMLLTLKSRAKAEGGFIFGIGPFPIIGATSKTMFYVLLIASIIFLLFFAIISLSGK
jgi:uncharacterized membrane protein